MISTTRRMPWIAAPMPLPTIAISEIGVLQIRWSELPRRPWVTAIEPTHLGDVLAHDEDALVLAKCSRERVADRFAIRDLRHRRT